MWGYNKHPCEYNNRVTSPCRVPPHSGCRTRSFHRSCSPEVHTCPKKPTYQRYCSAPVSTRNWSAYSELQPVVNKITLQQPPGKRNESKKMPKNKATAKEKVNTPKKEVNSPKKEVNTPKKEGMNSSKKAETQPATKKNHVEDHEYVHFLLKITEDILRNNIYATEELEKLFKSHVNANRGRLDEDKMWEKIEQLKKELNLPLPEKELACACNDATMKSADCTCCTNKGTNQNVSPNSCICDNPKCPSHVATTTKPSFEEDLRESPAEEPKPEEVKPLEQKDPLQEKCDPKTCDRQPPTLLPTKKPSVLFKEVQDAEEATAETSIESNKSQDILEESTDPKPSVSQSEKRNSKGDCIDPVHCTFQNVNDEDPKTKQSKISNVLFSPNPSTAASMPSVVKIVPKDDPNSPTSQVILYNNKDMDEQCICNVSHQKTVLKIELENSKDEEYILVNGPICMPLSMLEKKTVPVLVENVSSVILNTEDAVHDAPSFSRVNLFHGADDPSFEFEEGNLDSVSALIRKLQEEPDFDLTPQRDIEEDQDNPDKQPEGSGEFLLKSQSNTKDSGELADNLSENKNSVDFKIPQENEEKPLIKETESDESKTKQDKDKKLSVTKCTPETCPKKTKQQKTDKDVGKPDTALMDPVLMEPAFMDPTLMDEPLQLDPSGENKYHYLLKDVSTSTSSGILYEKSPVEVLLEPIPAYKSESEDIGQPDSSKEEVLPLEDYVQEEIVPQKESNEEYKMLMDDEYEMKPSKEPSVETATILKSVPSEREDLSAKMTSDDIDFMLKPEKTSSLGSQEPPALIEEPVMQHTWSPVVPDSPSHKPEGLKVRYSVNYDDAGQIIARLDNMPKADKPIDNASAISEKMKEFRKIGGDENEMRRFQISNPENFEIRRVSTAEPLSDEQDDRVKSTCCGLGKKRLSASN